MPNANAKFSKQKADTQNLAKIANSK